MNSYNNFNFKKFFFNIVNAGFKIIFVFLKEH